MDDEILEIEKAAEVEKEKPKPEWKIKIEKLLEKYSWIGMMTAVTFYALFMDDIKILIIPMSADIYIDVVTLIAMGLFLTELVLSIIAVDKYFLGFYFWVDVLSLLSMLPDISFILDGIEGGIGGAGGDGVDIAKSSRASRVIKIIRIVRLIRLLRLVKLYKHVKEG